MNFEDIANDPEIEIVVEVMGGKQPAMNYILACLDAGKNVVTANKDLVASEGKKILAAAKRNGKDFLYEASVAGGIPIIRPVKQCLAANHITELMGIFNGTTNFILTKMSQEGMEFGDALRLAQDMGYAEADPTADVEGLDAGRKVAILASAAFNSRVTFEDVYTEGITKITATDIEYAKEMGCTIKLLGVAKDTPEGIEARVHPMLIDSNHPLATVNDSYNAVFVRGDAVDNAMFLGRGAGERGAAGVDRVSRLPDLPIPGGWNTFRMGIAAPLVHDDSGGAGTVRRRYAPAADSGGFPHEFDPSADPA